MITIFHGDSQASSRANLLNALSVHKQKGVEITTLDGDKIMPAELESALTTRNLFADTVIVIENLLCRLRSRAKDECLALLSQHQEQNQLFLWEKKEVTKANLAKLKDAKVFISKTPVAIFNFLDSLYPGNTQTALSLLHEACGQSEEIIVFTLLARQVSYLIQLVDGAEPKLAPWQVGKLKGLARRWSLPQLTHFHDELVRIDHSIKSGRSTLSYQDHLDILLTTLLRWTPMQFAKPVAKNDLEKILLDSVENDTPEGIKLNPLIDLNQKGEFTFTLTHDHLTPFGTHTNSLDIDKWFENYRKEAMVSTAGIRGLQNPLYPWDTRYPLNLVGVMLATMGKILVAQDQPSQKSKIAACEVRYNSPQYVELIARLQAAYQLKTLVTQDYLPIPIFLISFLIFMYDLYGGEYVTSSHAISKKIATKDLNTQGSQYIPDESMLFVNKVKLILDEVREKGSYTFKFSAKDTSLIDRTFLASINNGTDLYAKYLESSVATPSNLALIKKAKRPILIECMGGSIYHTINPVLQKLKIDSHFHYLHQEEDPFFHRIGKVIDENEHFFDWSCDTTIMKANQKTRSISVPVVDTANYSELLKEYPIGTTLLMTDPDADRLVTAYIESSDNIARCEQMGLAYGKLSDERILVIFTPNQSFLLTVDFQYQALLRAGLWDKYDWFMMKTTASQRSWDEWAAAHKIPVINTPVGFKELADSMQQIEKKMRSHPNTDVFLKDVYGNNHNLGKNPRMLFAGEESGGEIFGPATLISSLGGRQAISMREKSAGEAIIITAALSAHLEATGQSLIDYLEQIFTDNQIKSRYEIRIDQKYYNESEPDIATLLAAKAKGMQIKTQNNSYFLSLALGYRDGLLTLEQVRSIMTECFPELNFADLSDTKFVGDGTYFLFDDKCLEVRPSGTDAVNKAYSYGLDQWECIKYAQAISAYDGTRNPLHQQLIPQDFYNKIEDYAFQLYTDYKQNQ